MQKLQLSIPEPCHENWQQMTPTEQGRFCNACAKEVIDFSTMTDIQVLNYFTNMTNEKVCGRALPEQLDRTLSRPVHPKKKILWYWNYIAMFLMFFTKGNTAKAQGNKNETHCAKAITAAELDKVKQTNINEALAGKVGGMMVVINWVISGKVTDTDGNPVPFASVKMKGTRTGISADANGAYSLKINSNVILVISAAGYKEVEVPVGDLKVISTMLEKATGSFIEGALVITTGGMGFRDMDEYTAPVKTKFIAVIKVKATETNEFIPNAAIVISSSSSIDTVLTNKKGEYKIKDIRNYLKYFIKVTAEGYEPNEFTIDGSDFNDRKKEWEVLLKKKKVQAVNSTEVIISATDNPVRLRGAMIALSKDTGALYVVDGTIVPDGENIKPEDIDNITVLQGPAAAALFGPDGSNGAIVITSRKAKEKKLDTVTVTGYGRTTGKLVHTVITSYTLREKLADTLKVVATKINGAIKIYPNPVQRGQQFSVALKLKEAGLYQLQIADAAGRIVLQKQVNANAKELTEKVMTDSRWSAGIYYVSIFNSKNQLTGKTSFIFE